MATNPVRASFDRWWNGISLRAKVTGVTVLLLTIGLTVAGAGTMTVLRTYLLERVDEGIAAVASGLPAGLEFDLINRDFGYDVAAGQIPYYLAAVSSSGDVLDDNLTSEQDDFAPVTTNLRLSDVIELAGQGITLVDPSNTVEWRVIAYANALGSNSEQATLVIGRDLRDTNALLGRYAAIFLLFAIAVVVLGAMATQLLVTGAFMPLRDVERTAARFAAGDYSQRLGGATPNTEVGRLSRSLNTMLARIDRAFADRARTVDQMRRFVGDASHELRTPLVSLRGYAELYRMGALQKPDDVAQAMDRIEREAIRMGGLVEDLLELARLDEARPLERVAVDLLSIAQDAALDAAASAPERRITVVVPEPVFDELARPRHRRQREALTGTPPPSSPPRMPTPLSREWHPPRAGQASPQARLPSREPPSPGSAAVVPFAATPQERPRPPRYPRSVRSCTRKRTRSARWSRT